AAHRAPAPAADRPLSARQVLLLERHPAAAGPRRSAARLRRRLRDAPRSFPGARRAFAGLGPSRGPAGDAFRDGRLGGKARPRTGADGEALRRRKQPDGDGNERRSPPAPEADRRASLRARVAGPARGAGAGARALRAAATAVPAASGEREVRRCRGEGSGEGRRRLPGLRRGAPAAGAARRGARDQHRLGQRLRRRRAPGAARDRRRPALAASAQRGDARRQAPRRCEFALKWEKWLADGFISSTTTRPESPAVRREQILAAAMQVPASESAPGLEINIVPDYRVWDGRFGNISWLQELP